jgi:hypothetical protein
LCFRACSKIVIPSNEIVSKLTHYVIPACFPFVVPACLPSGHQNSECILAGRRAPGRNPQNLFALHLWVPERNTPARDSNTLVLYADLPANWPLKIEMHPGRQAGGDDMFSNSLGAWERLGKYVLAKEEFVTLTEESAQLTEEFAQLTEEFALLTEEFALLTEEFAQLTEEFVLSTEEFALSTEEFAQSTEEFAQLPKESVLLTEGFVLSTEESALSTEEALTVTDESYIVTEEAYKERMKREW